MKNMRKLFAMVLAVVMVLSLATVAFADETTYTLTLNGVQEGHTYSAYQIFVGDLNESTLSNIVWGNGVTEAGQAALGNAREKAESLLFIADSEAFAAEVAPYLADAAGSVTIGEGETSGEISGLIAGYYLVMTTATTETDGVYTYYIMKVVKDTEANIKADVPEISKTVDDVDISIGDTVTFTLTATMTSNLQGYETYQIVFHDTLSAGLDYVEESAVVTIDGADKTDAFTIVEENGNLTISCQDVLAQDAHCSSQIAVTYEATLDADAVIGTDGNSNKVYLTYSNDPNWDGEGEEPTGDTPEDEVKVYTWEIPVFKYTEEGEGEEVTQEPLAGAGFTLYDGEDAITLTQVEGTNIYKVDPNGSVTEIVTDETGEFEIEGLKQGTYVLVETTTPAGYNTCEDVTVVIGEDGALSVDGEAVTTVGILNKAGSVLPETGGMGTTIFYILGSILTMAAVVLLITKKRMASAE